MIRLSICLFLNHGYLECHKKFKLNTIGKLIYIISIGFLNNKIIILFIYKI